MTTSTETSNRPLRGIAALLNDSERKELFRKYLYLLGWIEILILIVCWLYQLGDGGHDRFGSVEVPFPWKAYFLIAFLTPVAVTFLVGVVVVGFNKYFAEAEPLDAPQGENGPLDETADGAGRIQKLNRMVNLLRRLPFLALLLLLGVAVAFFYKIDVILGFLGSVGEKSVRIFLISAAVLVGLASIFALILIVLNFQLRKRSMEYQYRSDVAQRFGLIILDDNTVLNSEGKLLVNGRKWKQTVPLLSGQSPDSSSKTAGEGGPAPRTVDCETT